ncbi:MAG TPA: DnaJ domain-containing protein [Acetobacteraceae bacterium]|nr:DnaJ domain-containing protein [Acetobacteraceae bacterium]
MIWLLLGGLVLLLLLGGLRAFERASITSIKLLFAWIAALGGLVLALLLILTGRGALAFFALSLLYPLIRERWLARWPRVGPGAPPPPGSGAARSGGPMSLAEAYEVLGLKAGASEAEIQEAYLRLMRAAHPDSGGSDWLAARINQARDILLGKGGRRR